MECTAGFVLGENNMRRYYCSDNYTCSPPIGRTLIKQKKTVSTLCGNRLWLLLYKPYILYHFAVTVSRSNFMTFSLLFHKQRKEKGNGLTFTIGLWYNFSANGSRFFFFMPKNWWLRNHQQHVVKNVRYSDILQRKYKKARWKLCAQESHWNVQNARIAITT